MTQQLILTFSSPAAAADFRRTHAASPEFTIADYPVDDPTISPPYSPDLYLRITDNIHSTLKLEYGDLADWPHLPYEQWNNQDRHELYHRAATRWELLPTGEFRKHLFLEDFEGRAIQHLGSQT